jgi:glycine cleavage system H protein
LKIIKIFLASDQVAGIESVNAPSDRIIPVEGIVTDVNTSLEDDPSIINKDAEGNG